MKRTGKRTASPEVGGLETRLLLSGGIPSGTWIGQDGHDLVGPTSILGGDDVQDIHIRLDGLPTDRTISSAVVQGLGGDEWQLNGPFGPWAAALSRSPGSTSADLYLEPGRVETGRPFTINLRYDDGSTAGFWVDGGSADPNLRVASASVQVGWVGQDGQDRVGPSPSVGPDGVQDAHLTLSRLSGSIPITSVLITGPGGLGWRAGTYQGAEWNAELFRRTDDPTRADLFLTPPYNLNGLTLTVTVVYANGKTDTGTVVAGVTDAGRVVPAPAAISASWNQVSARWIGQDGINLNGPGDVHLAVDGLPAGRKVVAATLSDGVSGSWAYRSGSAPAGYFVDPYATPLAFRPVAGSATRADLAFPPLRTEVGATMTLRLLLDDGSTTIAEFIGGAADTGLRTRDIAASSVVARPGDNLNDLANRFGTVRLTAGTYVLDHPLILNNPVTIQGVPGAVIVFAQGTSEPAWTAAIKIQSGHTTLDGFAVRFSGPVRWNRDVSYGPAVIGTTDNFDPGNGDIRLDLAITHLDIEGPPPSGTWEEAPRLIRMGSASSGRIANNVLKGGTTEFLYGPWEIVGNDYRGTVPGTYSYAVFAGHDTEGLILKGNHAQPVGASGKTWRFLVLTGSGHNDLVEGNVVVGIGPRDVDTIPSDNAAEIILTEAYSLHFEGKPASISTGGRIIQIPTPQGGPARAGDVVSVLSGPQAGHWRKIVQVISPTAYLLDAPLPGGDYAVSVATGFVNEVFRGNVVDSRGSSVAADLVLVGNHYGTQVFGNHLLGGGEAIRITAAPTESPVQWGWSHAPYLGGLIASNRIEDALRGVTIAVEHSPAIKMNGGRRYLDVVLNDNTVVWTDAFLADRARSGATGNPGALTIGDPGAIDPGELVVQAANNAIKVPIGSSSTGTLLVNVATINGQVLVDQRLTLPPEPLPAPGGLRLGSSAGPSSMALATEDGRVRFDAVVGAAGYAYRLGISTAYTPIGNLTSFVPAGLVPGCNTVFVHAIDASGQPGGDTAISFNYAPNVPLAGIWLGQDGRDLVGPYPVEVPDGTQDIHLALTGLKPGRTVAFVDVQGLGGGQWQFNGAWGPWKVALVRAPGATVADLYLQPYQVETGRSFAVTVRYDDGSTASAWVVGGPADPGRRVATPPAALALTAPPAAESPLVEVIGPSPLTSASAPIVGPTMGGLSGLPTVRSGVSTRPILEAKWTRRPLAWLQQAGRARGPAPKALRLGGATAGERPGAALRWARLWQAQQARLLNRVGPGQRPGRSRPITAR